MKLCPSCGTNNKGSSKFCSSCGKKLPGKNKCPHCNKLLKSTDSLCKYCGKRVKEEKQCNAKKKLGKLEVSLIYLAAFLGFIIIVAISLLLFARYYLVDQYTFNYDHKGETQLVKKESIPEFNASNLTVCDSIDVDTFLPLSSKNEFEMGFKEIYATVSLDGITGDDLIGFKWIREDTGEEVYDYTYDRAIKVGYFSGNVYFPLVIHAEEDFMDYPIFNQPGNYRVELYHNKKLVDSAPFEVSTPEAVFSKQVIFDTFDAEKATPLNTREKFMPESKQLLSGVRLSGGVEKDDDFQFILKDDKGQTLKDNKANYYDLAQKDFFEDDYIYFYIYGPHSQRINTKTR